MKTLYVVATPIGNLNDVSKRCLEILDSVDLICAEDTRQTIKLLNHYNIKKKMISYHKYNETIKVDSIVDDLLSGKDIALVSDAGTPCISDPGYVLVKACREKNINVIAVPGCSATVTSLSISGLDTSQFSFIGFIPQDNKKFSEEIDKMKSSLINTFIIYESPKRLVKLVEKLKDNFSDSTIFIASDLTKIHERSFFGNINEVYETIKNDSNIEKGEYVVVLQKKETKKEIQENDISIEALLVDTMIKNNCSMKDAIKLLNESNKDLKKNEIYEASLKLKELL